MKLIIGLGNPGTKFLNNRHNAGRLFAEQVKSKIKNQKLKVLETDCFMNNSGVFVKKITRTQNLEPSNLYVVHDDLDLRLGTYKIQFGVGPKVHHGLQSLERELGTPDFWRIRIGVDNRDPNNRISGDEYVLQDFTKEETEILKGVFDEIVGSDSFKN